MTTSMLVRVALEDRQICSVSTWARAISHSNPMMTLSRAQSRKPRSVMAGSNPTVAAENSARVLPWHSICLASESRSKPHPHHHSLSEHPQSISAAVLEHSTIEQTREAICAPLKVDHSQSDKSQDCLALLLRRWQSQRPQYVTTTKHLSHSRRSETVAVAPVEQHRPRE